MCNKQPICPSLSALLTLIVGLLKKNRAGSLNHSDDTADTSSDPILKMAHLMAIVKLKWQWWARKHFTKTPKDELVVVSKVLWSNMALFIIPMLLDNFKRPNYKLEQGPWCGNIQLFNPFPSIFLLWWTNCGIKHNIHTY